MPRTIAANIKRHLAELTLAAGGCCIAIALLTGTPEQAAGVALVVMGGISRARRSVERVIRDTSRERDRLQRALDEAEAEHKRYIAARAVVDHEAERLCQQMAKAEHETAERLAAALADLDAQAAAEREELLAEVEDRRNAIKLEGWVNGYDAGERGILAETSRSTTGATVIHLPLSALKSDVTTAGTGSSQRP